MIEFRHTNENAQSFTKGVSMSSFDQVQGVESGWYLDLVKTLPSCNGFFQIQTSQGQVMATQLPSLLLVQRGQRGFRVPTVKLWERCWMDGWEAGDVGVLERCAGLWRGWIYDVKNLTITWKPRMKEWFMIRLHEWLMHGITWCFKPHLSKEVLPS